MQYRSGGKRLTGPSLRAACLPRCARDLNGRFAEWFYVISDADFQKLRLKRKDVAGGG